jgi:amino acid transporter
MLPTIANGQLDKHGKAVAPKTTTVKVDDSPVKRPKRHWTKIMYLQGTVIAIILIALIAAQFLFFNTFIEFATDRFGVGGTGLYLLFCIGVLLAAFLILVGLFNVLHPKPKKPVDDSSSTPIPIPKRPLQVDH